MLIKTILAGTFIFQGCTADGACWPTFITQRDVRVAVVETLEDKYGVCLCDGPSPIIMVLPDFYMCKYLCQYKDLCHVK